MLRQQNLLMRNQSNMLLRSLRAEQTYPVDRSSGFQLQERSPRKPEIFIFDDSFSALDFKTDSTLRKALKEHTKDATTIIVAQRISTILNADKIIVLDDGHMAGIGTHGEFDEKL